MAYQMALQLQQQHQSTQQSTHHTPNANQLHTAHRQVSPGAVSVAVAGLCTAGEFSTPKTPSGVSPQGTVRTSTGKQSAPRSKDPTMGLLRNGKAYSPCGKGTTETEKRRLSWSSEKDTPLAKRRDQGQQPIVMMRSLSSSNINSDSANTDVTMQAFMSRMEKLVTNTLTQMRKENAEVMKEVKAESGRIKTLADNALKEIKTEGDKYMAAAKAENNKLSQELTSLKRSIDSQASSITSVKKNLKSVESDLTACFADAKVTVESQGQRLTDLENKVESIPESSDDIVDRISKLEQIAADITTKLDNISVEGEAELYPTRKSIVAMQVRVKANTPLKDVAEMIIQDVLGLPEVQVIRAETVDEYDDDKYTLKILLDSAASVKKVLESKTKLRTCTDRDIRAIWIRRSKTNEQRMLERNCAILLREVDKAGKFRQNDQGRIVPVKTNRGVADPNHENADTDTETSDLWADNRSTTGPIRGRGSRPSSNSRSRRPQRGRGGHSGRGGRSRNSGQKLRGGNTTANNAARNQSGERQGPPKLQVSARALEMLSNESAERGQPMDTSGAPDKRGGVSL